MDQFRRQVVLSEDPVQHQIKMAKVFGAYEVYDYLLTMSEEDVSD